MVRRRRLAALATIALAASGLAAVSFAAAMNAQAATAGCRVDYTVTNQWSTGFGTNVAITNTGGPLTSWTLTWTFPGNQQVTQGWNATFGQSGAQVSATSMSYNGALGTGASTSIGFNGSYSGSNAVPTSFAINGVACNGATTPTATPSASKSPTVTPSTSTSPSPTVSPSKSPSASPTRSPSPSPTVSAGGGVTVAKDGSGNYTTIQAAVDAAPANQSGTYTINIKSGVYREIVTVSSSKTHLALHGLGATSSDVVIVNNHAAGSTKPDGSTYGTFGSATAFVDGHDFAASNLTIANDFDYAGNPNMSARQAVALNIKADRAVLDNVRLLGNQDTLLVNTGSRVYFRQSYIAGNVDFIFGAGIAVFDRCEIHTISRGSTSNNGAITAASTLLSHKYGFLFSNSTLTSDSPKNSVYLGRPWHPSGDVNAIAQVVFRNTTMGAHIRSDPWTDMSGFSWKDARFFEYGSTGPGAGVNSNRPQLSDAQAADYTPEKYLAGSDGWNPLH
jgi:pectin methylesterase-like acyl-CoA thioesterase